MSKSFVRRRDAKHVESFAKCSYLTQVRRLRRLGVEALTHYSINVAKVEFIHHGENATFKVTDRSGAKYLLRIHREGYHSQKAIIEEVSWLERLVKSGQLVPAPIASKTKEKVVFVTNRCLDLQRYCCVFKWVDGRFINKSLSRQHMFKIGALLAKLQMDAPKETSRRYWDADGLIGSQATFGSFDFLEEATPKQQGIITGARKNTLSKLRRYQRKHPDRMGLIHADPHFGNLFLVGSKIGAIDFDDCGFGFKVYDLVVTYVSMQNILGQKRKKDFESYRVALIDGYRSIHPWDDEDERLFHHLVTSRRLSMLGWLNSRADNPKLKRRLKSAIETALKHIKDHS